MSRLAKEVRGYAKLWHDMPIKFVRLLAKKHWRFARLKPASVGKSIETPRQASERLNKIIRFYGRPDKQIIFPDNRDEVVAARLAMQLN